MIARFMLPAGSDHAALPLLIGRAIRSFADGYMAVILPAYLLAVLKAVGMKLSVEPEKLATA